MPKTRSTPIPVAQLISEYAAFPDDQPVTEAHAAVRLQLSRAWLQWKRGAGGGPMFNRTSTGKIFYRKRDIEQFLSERLTECRNTSEYQPSAEYQPCA